MKTQDFHESQQEEERCIPKTNAHHDQEHHKTDIWERRRQVSPWCVAVPAPAAPAALPGWQTAYRRAPPRTTGRAPAGCCCCCCSVTYESARMSTSPQACKLKLIKRRANLETWACTVPKEITLHQFCHVQELYTQKHDHNASWCDQAWKFLETILTQSLPNTWTRMNQ